MVEAMQQEVGEGETGTADVEARTTPEAQLGAASAATMPKGGKRGTRPRRANQPKARKFVSTARPRRSRHSFQDAGPGTAGFPTRVGSWPRDALTTHPPPCAGRLTKMPRASSRCRRCVPATGMGQTPELRGLRRVDESPVRLSGATSVARTRSRASGAANSRATGQQAVLSGGLEGCPRARHGPARRGWGRPRRTPVRTGAER